MIPNTNIKNIIAKTQTTDFFIACKESRIENNTSFYGCFYLGPFDDSLSQTLANNIRRTLLSELTGLAITSIEIEGILHNFSSIPGMKETVLDLICNLQNIVLKKQEISITYRTLRSTKKTYIGFLNVSGPRVIKAMDLKLPSGLQCVDPNQYIATLAEDGLLNMKLNINEGKNFIKQKPHNLDVSVLKKRNILLQNFKKKTALSSRKLLKHNNNDRIKTNQATTKLLNTISLQDKTLISNPILLDAVFMPVTKINCIIEENNIYSDFSTDSISTYNQIFDEKIQFKNKLLPSKVIYTNQPKTEQLKTSLALSDKTVSNSALFLNAIEYNSIYQTCLVLKKTNTKNGIEQGESVSSNQRVQSLSTDLVTLQSQNENRREFQKGNKQALSFQQAKQKQNHFKLIPWQSDTLYFDISDMSRVLGHKLKKKPNISETMDYRLWLSKEQVWFPIGKRTNESTSFDVVPLQHASFSKIKTFLACKASKNSQLKTNQNQTLEKQPNIKKITTSKTKKKHKIIFCKTISTIFKNTFKIVNTNVNPIKQQTMYLEYAKNIKLKPLRKKAQLIVEIWTNGSIHPRQALYQCFTLLSNNFLKLQTVKMLGTMFKSELAYGNLKYSIRNNYNFYNADHIKKINFDKKNRRIDRETRELSTTSFAFGKINLLFNQHSNTSTRKTSLNQMNFYSQATLKAPIAILKISLSAYTALKKAGILTINDLVKYSKNDLLKINNIGKNSLVLIETSLSYLGLTLKK
uniref:DNA-directed RNA polymerase n=1 Tax=Volvox africanus TaxID=51714 RepID=A0A385KPP4_9CHLO|nr:RNA polymerase subunit alpha [Volvox africanus]AXZ97319.1 RNA polymerase subunit alpha [Volvox africanus]